MMDKAAFPKVQVKSTARNMAFNFVAIAPSFYGGSTNARWI